jgi:hypothetical protein
MRSRARPRPTRAGTLHLGILIENMRREGYEFEIGPPRVITRDEDGTKMEPFEDVRGRCCLPPGCPPACLPASLPAQWGRPALEWLFARL